MYPCGGEKGTRLKEISIQKTGVRRNIKVLYSDFWLLNTINDYAYKTNHTLS
jgi:hypothetical protein